MSSRRTSMRVCAIALFLLPLSTSPSRAQIPVGRYSGGCGTAGDFSAASIELSASGETPRGILRWSGERQIENGWSDGDRIRFAAGDRSFDLQRTETGLSGVARQTDGTECPAYFAFRPGAPPPELLATYEGTYDLGGGQSLTLSRNNDQSGFWYLEQPSGRTGFLYNLSDREFTAGACVYCAGPERLRVRFTPRVDRRRVDEGSVILDGEDRTARRAADFREEEVSFRSRDGTLLAGSLFLPATGAPSPAIVMVHGSGAQSRNGFYGHIRFLAEAYARRGIAVLAYDKRGVGGSAGDWETAGFALLADDAAAALRYLAGRPEVRADRLGLSGASQAGWIIPMAATRLPEVAILQMRVGSSPMGVEESERRRLERQMRLEGSSQAEIDRAMRVRSLMDEFAKTGEGWDALATAAAPVTDTIWMRDFIGGLPARDAPDWAWLREAFGYDVASDLARYGGSVQILFGGSDALLEPEAPTALAREALARGRASDVEVAVIPGMTHAGLEGVTGTDTEFDGLTRFAPGYFDRMIDWAAARLLERHD